MATLNQDPLEVVFEILSSDLGIAKSRLSGETALKKDLQLDSVEIVQLAMGIKKKVGVVLKFNSREELLLSDISQMIRDAKN